MRAQVVAAALLAPLAAVVAPPAAHAGPAGDADLAVFDGGLTQLAFIGLLQAQVVPLVGDDAFLQNGDPAEEPGFRLRRARFGVHGTAWADVDYELSFQATPAGIDLLDGLCKPGEFLVVNELEEIVPTILRHLPEKATKATASA